MVMLSKGKTAMTGNLGWIKMDRGRKKKIKAKQQPKINVTTVSKNPLALKDCKRRTSPTIGFYVSLLERYR